MGRVALILQMVLAAAGWALVGWLLTHTYPTEPRAELAVYGALFLALSATVGSLFWLAPRVLKRNHQPRLPLAYLSHGMVFSGLALFGLWMQSLRLLSP